MSRPSPLTQRFSEALTFATELHAEQNRKGGDIPYIGHLLSVAGLVIEAHGTEVQAIAALLHDAAEDQGGQATLTEIDTRFGPDVARIVAECSDTFEQPKPPWRERKERYVAHLQDASAEAVLVSLADKLDNTRAILRDLRTDGPELWKRFAVSDPQEHLWYYRALLGVFTRRSDSSMVEELRRTIAALEQLAARPTGFAGKRLSAVQRTLEQTQAWIAEQEAEMQDEYTHMSPGDPDDDWEYNYNASVKRVLVRSRQTVSSLEAERDAITAEQARRQPRS